MAKKKAAKKTATKKAKKKAVKKKVVKKTAKKTAKKKAVKQTKWQSVGGGEKVLTKEIAEEWRAFLEKDHSPKKINEFLDRVGADRYANTVSDDLIGLLISSLHHFTLIEDAAAEVLAEDDHLYLDGLTTLSDAAAKALGKQKSSFKKPYLDLMGLTTLSDTAAKGLAKHTGYLDLSGLTTISDAAAEALAKKKKRNKYHLSLSDAIEKMVNKYL